MTAVRNWSKAKKIGFSVLAVYILGLILFAVIFGVKSHKAPTVASGVFTPVDEFRLDTWFKLGPVPFNKGVLYLLLTCGFTIGIMTYVAKRMQSRPNRMQVAVESLYNLTQSMSQDNMGKELTKKYFPLICTLFVFILVTNLLGYIPMPVNSGLKVLAVRTESPVIPAVRRRHERGLPADPVPVRVRHLQLRGRQAPRCRRLHEEPHSGRRVRGDAAS